MRLQLTCISDMTCSSVIDNLSVSPACWHEVKFDIQ